MNTSVNKDYRMLAFLLLISYPLVDYVLRQVLQIPVISSFWDDLLLILLLAAARLTWFVTSDSRNTPVSSAIFLVMMLGFIWVAMDLAGLSTAIEGYRSMFEYMLVFFASFMLLRDKKQLYLYLAVIAALGGLMGLHGLWQYVAGVPTPGNWTDAAEGIRARAFSIVGSPNAFGSHMAFAGPIALLLAFWEKRWPWRLVWLAAAGLCGVGLLLSFSRGAWLAAAGAIGIVSIAWDKRLLIAGLIVALGVGLAVAPVRERVTYLFSYQYMEKSQNDGRIARWLDAYDQMRAEPVFGQGLGRYGGAVAQRRYGTTYVDNYYMKTLAETGLLGLGLYLWLQATVLWCIYRTWQKKSLLADRLILSGMTAGILALLLHNGVENIFEIPYLNIYYWITVGWVLSFPYFKDTKQSSGEEV